MKKYYIQKDGIKKGPYSVEDLKSMNITEETQVALTISDGMRQLLFLSLSRYLKSDLMQYNKTPQRSFLFQKIT